MTTAPGPEIGSPGAVGECGGASAERSLLHDGEQVAGGEHEVLLPAVLDLGAAVLGVDDDVAHVHVERDAVAVVVDAAGAHGDDRALLRLLLGGVRDDQTGGGGGLGLVGLDHDPVLQRLDADLGSGRHVGDAPFGVGRLVDVLLSCGTGSGHPPSRGSGASPCRLALYPRECQPLNRVTRMPDLGVRQAEVVPNHPPADDAVAQFRWLRSPEGTAAGRLAGRLIADGVDLLPGLDRMRTEVGPEHAGPAWELARLRARARPVFGADAEVLFLTPDALEQAGRPELAARRAARLLAGGVASAADLGCAAGTDTVALARAGAD